MKTAVMVVLVGALVSGCSTEQMVAANQILSGARQVTKPVGDTLYEGTRDMNKHPAPTPAVTFDQPAAQPDVRTVWIDAGNGRQRYFCTGSGPNTRCWQ